MNDQKAINDIDIWNILMSLAEPKDLLRTILNDATTFPSMTQTLILSDCTVTIHQHYAPNANPEPPPLSPT